ncbi:MAG: hypothetical protein ACYC61_14160 [Isosphaeraceae bacterium]
MTRHDEPPLPGGCRPVAHFERPGEVIPGYAVRDDGTVLYWDGVRKRSRPRWIPLKVKAGPNGFHKVRLRIDGKEREIGVALIVLRAFAGPRPLGCEPLHFPDPDPGNNQAANLRWAPRGSSKQGRTLGPSLPVPRRGSRHPNAALVEADIPEIRADYRAGFRIAEIAAERGVSEEAIRHVLVGETWSSVPDPLGPIKMRRGPEPESSPRARLDWEAVRAIRAGHAAGRSYGALAAEHGVSKCTVRDIIKGRTWREH